MQISTADLSALIQAVTLLIVAITAAITVWTHNKVSQIPNKVETMTVAKQLSDSNGHLEKAVQELTAKIPPSK